MSVLNTSIPHRRDISVLTKGYGKNILTRQSRLYFSEKECRYTFGKSKLERKIQELSRTCSEYLETSKHLSVMRSVIKEIPKDSYPFAFLINKAYESTGNTRDVYFHLAKSVYRYRCLDILHGKTETKVSEDFFICCADPFYGDSGKDQILIEYRRSASYLHPEFIDFIHTNGMYRAYNYEVMPFWKYHIADYKFALKAGNPISDIDIMEFRDTMYRLLPKFELKFDPSFFNTLVKQSSIFSIEAGKNIRRYSISNLTEIFKDIVQSKKTYDWIFNRTVIPVSNGNIRDTFVPCIETYSMMAFIEEISRQICQRIPEIKIGKEIVPLEPRDNITFEMIDIKKFGLTFPRKLIELTMKIIQEVYNIDIQWLIDSYNHSFVYIDGKKEEIKRGFGLGNLNFTATLAYYTICKCTGYKFFIYSDDVIFWHEGESKLEIIENHIKRFGLEINLKKSYSSRFPEFLGRCPTNSFYEFIVDKSAITIGDAVFTCDDYECYQKEVNLLNDNPQLKPIFMNNHHYRKLVSPDLLKVPTRLGGYIRMFAPQEWADRHFWSPEWIYRPPKTRITSTPLDDIFHLRGVYAILERNNNVSLSFKSELRQSALIRHRISELKRIRSAEAVDPSTLHTKMYELGLYPRSSLKFARKGKKPKLLPPLIIRGVEFLQNRPYYRFTFNESNDFIKVLNLFTDFPIERYGILSTYYGRTIIGSKWFITPKQFPKQEYLFYRIQLEELDNRPTIREVIGENHQEMIPHSHTMIHYDEDNDMDLELEIPDERFRGQKGFILKKIPNLEFENLGNLTFNDELGNEDITEKIEIPADPILETKIEIEEFPLSDDEIDPFSKDLLEEEDFEEEEEKSFDFEEFSEDVGMDIEIDEHSEDNDEDFSLENLNVELKF